MSERRGAEVGGGLGLELGAGEVVAGEVAMGGEGVEAVQGEVLVEARQAEEALEGGLLHLEDVAEAHVVGDEGEDLGGVVAGEAQAGEDGLGDAHAGLDVAVETDAVGLFIVAGDCRFGRLVGGGLADVVEQRGPGEGCAGLRRELFEHQHGVGPDVALGVELGRLGYAAQADGLGQDLGEEAEIEEQLEAAARASLGEDAGEFVADALGADLGDLGGEAADGGGGYGVDLEVEARGEADGAHHAQLVLGEAQCGVADGADDAGGEVFAAMDEVERGAGGVAGGRADRGACR